MPKAARVDGTPVPKESGLHEQRSSARASFLSRAVNAETSALVEAADHDNARGRHASAAAAYLKLDAQIDRLPDLDRARGKLRLASALHGAGRWRDAYHRFEEAEVLRGRDDLALEVEALLAWSQAREAEGDVLGARALARDAYARADDAGRHRLAAEAAYRAAKLHGDPHPSDEVLAWVTRGLKKLASDPDPRLDLLLRLRRAVNEGALTTTARAIRELQSVLNEASQFPDVRVTVLGYLADQHERNGELEKAERELKEGLTEACRTGLVRHAGRLAVHSAVVAMSSGKDLEGQRLYARSLEFALDAEALHVPLLREVASIAVATPRLVGPGAAIAPLARVKEALNALEPLVSSTFSFQARRMRELPDRVEALRVALRGLLVRGLQFENCIVNFGSARLYVPTRAKSGSTWLRAGTQLPAPAVQAISALDLLGTPATAEQIWRAGGGKTEDSVGTALKRLRKLLEKRGVRPGIVSMQDSRWALAGHRPLGAAELEDLVHPVGQQLSLAEWGESPKSGGRKP